MSGYDESVANLQQFIGETSSASAYLTSAAARLDNASSRIDELEQDAQGDVGDTNEALAEAEERLAAGRESALGALEALAQVAEEGASSAIDAQQDRLEDAAQETEDAAEAAREDLEDAYDRLSEDGFRETESSLADLGSAADDASNDATTSFGGLADAVTALTGRGDTLRGSVSDGLGEVETEVEAETQGLGERFDAVKQTWHQQVDDVLSAECAETGDELQSAYSAWGEAVGQVADDLREKCTAAAEELAGFLDEQAHQALETAVGEMLRGEAEQLLAEEGASAAAGEAAAAIGEALAAILGDLRIAVNVVGDIDRLLDELKG